MRSGALKYLIKEEEEQEEKDGELVMEKGAVELDDRNSIMKEVVNIMEDDNECGEGDGEVKGEGEGEVKREGEGYVEMKDDEDVEVKREDEGEVKGECEGKEQEIKVEANKTDEDDVMNEEEEEEEEEEKYAVNDDIKVHDEVMNEEKGVKKETAEDENYEEKRVRVAKKGQAATGKAEGRVKGKSLNGAKVQYRVFTPLETKQFFLENLNLMPSIIKLPE